MTIIAANNAGKLKLCQIVASRKSCKTAWSLCFEGVAFLFWVSIVLAAASVALTMFQVIFFTVYRVRVLSRTDQAVDPNFQPDTAIILCLRGADPSIRECLRSIEQQDYRNFELNIVVDDREDPALGIVHEFTKEATIVPQVHWIPERLSSCSLKCSAVISGIKNASKQAEVFALIDADAIVAKDWLSRLIAPLADPEVGASTGNRWFAIPSRNKLASTVRCIWNAAAIVQMYLYEIPWGGSLAMRRDVIEKTNLLDHWSRGFCEDTMLTRILHRDGYRIARPTELVVVNDEATTYRGAFRWIQRQLLTVRLHHPRWPFIWVHGVGTGLPLLGVVLLGLSLYLRTGVASMILLLTLLIFELVNYGMLLGVHDVNRKLLERSGQTQGGRMPRLLYALALPATQVIHFFANLAASVTKQVSWRQVRYEVGQRGVKLVKYQPFEQDPKAAEVETRSID